MGDLRAELLAAFETELADHLGAIRAALAELDSGRSVDLSDVSRRAHSLKGAARAVEQLGTEALAHEAETLLLALETGAQAMDAAAIGELRALTDAIEDSARGAATDGAAGEPAPATAESTPDRRVRVRGQHVEELARSLHNLANEVQQGAVVEEGLSALHSDLAAIVRLAERDNPEVARRVSRAMTEVERLAREQERLNWSIGRATREMERDAERILLLPVSTLFEGYERMVRELAASQGKSATLRVEAIDGEADRRVLQALREPVLHLLRNAVSHGIEAPAERRRAGKPEQGSITLIPRSERGQLSLTIRDDGAGIDYRAIERRARALGVIAADAPTPSRSRLRMMIFEQGFSTAETLDEVSGRGIGLSVVAEAVRRLHGRIRVAPSVEVGTEVTLSVPAALSRQTLLLVEAGSECFALPASAVVKLLRIAPDDIIRSEGEEMLVVDGEAVPIRTLAGLTGTTAPVRSGDHHAALLMHANEQQLVLVVDALSEVRSVLVGDPTAIAADVPLIYGTALVDRGVALVLSPDALMAQAQIGGGADALTFGEAAAPARRKTVLVVDDSITTRTLEKSLLEAQGYSVVISVDGLAGLERLRSGLESIDLVVADVEMPRMDGFGLLTAIRNDPALKTLPVVMMTSRNSPEDIERGLELGANAYVTKQEFDQGSLISVIQQLI